MTRQATVVAEGLYFGEGPRWHEGRLWFSDFYDHAIKSLNPDGSIRVEVALAPPARPSGLGWLPDGRLVFSDMLARRVLRREHDGRLVVHGDISAIATWHCNDLVVDAFGRVFIGNFGFDLDTAVADRVAGRPPTVQNTPAKLARVDLDGAVTEVAAELGFPNGTVITADHTTLIVAESFAARLTAFTLTENGGLTDRREWAALPGVAPDGICIDGSGQVWVANAQGSECILVAEGGEIIGRVETSQHTYACMLGGADGHTLYVLTAGSSSPGAVDRQRTGRIETARVDTGAAGGWPGTPEGMFRLQPRGHAGDLAEDPDGFVHLTMGRSAVIDTANRWYRGASGDFDVLTIDQSLLDPALLRFEQAAAGYFPHYYGTIPAAAITTRDPLRRYADGSFAG